MEKKLAFALFLVISCSPKTENEKNDTLAITAKGDSIESGFNEEDYESYLKLENYLETFSDPNAQIIDTTCAIIINPTEEQVAEMEEKYGEDFYTMADDNGYYQSEATSKLDSMNIKVIIMEKGLLKLVGATNTWILNMRKEGSPEWNLIFFHKNKQPEIVSSINVTNERIKEYFGNQ